jgi:signal transduction histidine kinase
MLSRRDGVATVGHVNLSRSLRDWLGDAAVTAGAVLLGLLMLQASMNDFPEDSKTAIPRDIAIGVVSWIVMLLWRRRHPVAIALVMTAAQLTASTVLGTAMAAVFSVAMLRPWRTSVPVAATTMLTVLGLFWLAPLSEREFQEGIVAFGLLHVALLSSGMLVRSRRQLIASLEERARAAETEQRLRVEEARLLERERIAREMHDVLAHRISLLAVHAGALEFRPDAPADQREAAGIIRQSAYEAMEDLREVIGVLRDDSPGADPERPQPTLGDVSALVQESRRAGGRITLEEDVPEPGRVPSRVGRHAYRIVQEGLTNARKHAPGARVRVSLAAGADLDIEIVNALPPDPPALPLPGAVAGLVGLAERVALLGGTLEHGRTGDGRFRLRARLPLDIAHGAGAGGKGDTHGSELL